MCQLGLVPPVRLHKVQTQMQCSSSQRKCAAAAKAAGAAHVKLTVQPSRYVALYAQGVVSEDHVLCGAIDHPSAAYHQHVSTMGTRIVNQRCAYAYSQNCCMLCCSITTASGKSGRLDFCYNWQTQPTTNFRYDMLCGGGAPAADAFCQYVAFWLSSSSLAVCGVLRWLVCTWLGIAHTGLRSVLLC